MALLRSGHDEAFQVIYDRYHKRLAGYARQMLPRGHDTEDALQDVFVRAYRALRHDNRELAVRPWLFRIVHNCCIDELRRTIPVPTDELSNRSSPMDDPAARVDAREALRRLIEDIQRLPEQQRSALLLRELSGLSYEEVAAALNTTVPAVKSLLVRARTGLVRAGEARDTACSDIREQIALAHDEGVRATPTVRRHLRDCPSCRSYRGQMRVVNKRVAALLPVGPLAALARLVGLPGGSATGTGGTAALGAGGTASGAVLGANHVAALVAAAIASAGGAVGLQHVIASGGSPTTVHRTHAGGRHPGATGSSSSVMPEVTGSDQYKLYGGTDAGYLLHQESPSGAAVTGSSSAGGAGNSAGAGGTGLAGGSAGPAISPTPTAPPGWGTTGPPPTARPTTGDTGPTPTGTGGDVSSGSPTPTDAPGSGTATGDSSGTSSSGAGSSGSVTGASPGSTGSTTGTSPTDSGTPSTGDPGATTAAASAASTGPVPSSAGSASSAGSSS